MAVHELSSYNNSPNKGIVGFRLEKSVPRETRESIVNGMTVENQNEILATLLALGTKPKTMFVNGKNVPISHDQLKEENLEYLNLIDEDIAYILDRTSELPKA